MAVISVPENASNPHKLLLPYFGERQFEFISNDDERVYCI